MKKLIASLIIFVSVFSLSFADNFLSHRYFEIKVDTPFLISNNTFLISDFLQEQVVIDLAQIADSVPEDGFNFSTNKEAEVPAANDVNINNNPNDINILKKLRPIYENYHRYYR